MKLEPNQWVGLWLILNLVGVGVYDVMAEWLTGGDGAVTAVLRGWAVIYPALPFLAGFLAGHLFGK